MSRIKIQIGLLLSLLLLSLPVPAAAHDRIISFRPNVTEILFALGLGAKVVGVTTYCHYPPEAEKIEKIGGYFNRSLEKILALRPDLVVFVPDTTTAKLEPALGRAGIKTLVVRAETIDDIIQSIKSIAAENDIPARGESLIRSMEKRIFEETKKVRGPRRKAVWVVQRRPLIIVGGSTFLNELLNLAGGENIGAASRLPYPHFSLETILAEGPEIIFDMDVDVENAKTFWGRYSSLPAVRNDAVVSLSPEIFVPGPRMPEALGFLIQKINKVLSPPHLPLNKGRMGGDTFQ